MAKASSDTPLMQQHRSIKAKYPDAILLFRVGDFYETLGQDAVITAGVLGITLTKRNNGAAADSELAGFPHHALDTYLHKLVKAGYRVAVCDQLEDPKQAKGIVKRGVTEMMTPGIATSDKLLEHNHNNFLCALHSENEMFGIALLDISTGEFLLAEGNREYADKLLQSLKPAEVIFQRNYQKTFQAHFGNRFYTYHLEPWIFDAGFAKESLLKHFQTHSLKGFGVENMQLGITAAGAVLHYLRETEHPHLAHITTLHRLDEADYLWMDRFTIRNLELLQGSNEDSNSLIRVMDHTVSPMGARLLRRWMVLPLKEADRIQERLGAVECLMKENELRKQLEQSIKSCGDVERLVSKLPLKKINPREVQHLAKGLKQVEKIKAATATLHHPLLQRISDIFNPCPAIAETILHTLIENPPATAAKGNLINEGVNEQLDELKKLVTNSKAYLLEIQQRESEKTGIPSLKIGFNNVFGYYLEVTHAQRSKVPDDWIRKQTLTNAERYITPELKEYEEKIMGAEEKMLKLESELFEELLAALQEYIAPIQSNGQTLAMLDCLCCFAENAIQYHYTKPVVHEGHTLVLKEARHPVIEQQLPPGEPYIANDLLLDNNTQQIIILTGPNMSGKSALLRQTALITLMAHMGSFVPAATAEIPLTDKIFTRVGASDNLSGGESTFMVEMNETASIINNLSERSLILLDEIGRGTSTYDGISIAWSIVEYLHAAPQKPKTFFATHYHELNELENKLERVKNYHVTNKEAGNKIIFLRKLAPGGSTHSFGIHVAKMAGMPQSLIDRANEMLKTLEAQRSQTQHGEALLQTMPAQMQLNIFDLQTQAFEEIRQLLVEMDINRLTPVEALLKLQEIKNRIR